MRLISDEAIAAVTIFQEAENQGHEGRVAVGEVILTRMKHAFHSDGTVIGTCCAPVQFSGWNATARNRIRSLMADDANVIVKDCLAAWHEALAGSSLTDGADSYFNPAIVTPPWFDQKLVVATIKDHVFLRLR